MKQFLPEGVELTPVKSSNIAKLGHLNDTLYVQFATGGLFSYAGFPAQEYDTLQKAESIGSHFAKHVRPKYKGTDLRKLTPEQMKARLKRSDTP